jgi:hypothetical protein
VFYMCKKNEYLAIILPLEFSERKLKPRLNKHFSHLTMPAKMQVRGTNGSLTDYTVIKSIGGLIGQEGSFFHTEFVGTFAFSKITYVLTKFIGDEACCEIMDMLRGKIFGSIDLIYDYILRAVNTMDSDTLEPYPLEPYTMDSDTLEPYPLDPRHSRALHSHDSLTDRRLAYLLDREDDRNDV